MKMRVKRNRFKKRIAAMMTVSALAIWFALPNMACAKTVTIEGRNIYATLTGNSSSATATISYTEGSGQVTAGITGFAHYNESPSIMATPVHNSSSNPTPGGASASVSAPSGCSFFTVFSASEYAVYINGSLRNGTIEDRLDF